MSIVVDTREHYIDKIKELIMNLPSDMIQSCPQFEFRCLGLNLGDYHITNGLRELGLERKNISDFCGSYPGLKDRLHNMRLHYQNVGLLLEGTYSVANGMIYVLEGSKMVPRMSYATFVNFLTHQASLNTWLYHSMCFEESIYQMIFIHNYLPRLDEPSPSMKCGSVSEWFVQLPGIAGGTIKKLKDKHASPIDAINNGLPKKAKEMLLEW